MALSMALNLQVRGRQVVQELALVLGSFPYRLA
jgi:hypothetical protein